MKTTKEDHEWLRMHAATCRKPGLFTHLTADLDRLAAIERAWAKGGLTDEELNQALGHVDAAGYQILRRLDDARNATNEELGRVRGMLDKAMDYFRKVAPDSDRLAWLDEEYATLEARDGK